MSQEKVKELAKRGGKAAQANGKAHRFTSKEASAAARVAHARGTAHSWTQEEAAAAGKKSLAARSEDEDAECATHAEPEVES